MAIIEREDDKQIHDEALLNACSASLAPLSAPTVVVANPQPEYLAPAAPPPFVPKPWQPMGPPFHPSLSIHIPPPGISTPF